MNKTKTLTLIFIITINVLSLAQADNDFLSKSEITGKVMEFLENIRFIRGDFKVENSKYILTAGQGKIDEKNDIMEAYINVKLIQAKYTLTCNKLLYYINEQKAVCIGSPQIVERLNKDTGETEFSTSTITGDRILNYIEEDRVVIEDNAKVKKTKIVNGKEILDYTLYCDNLTYYNKNAKAIAIGNVKIERTDSNAYGDRLVFYDSEGRIEIVGNASIERGDGDRVYGEKIIYFTKDDRVLIFKAKAEMIPGGNSEE